MTNIFRLFAAAMLVLAAAGTLASPAFASVSAQTECEADGGEWLGDGGSMATGTCTYPAGSTGFAAAGCDADADAYVTEPWILNVSQGFDACVAAETETGGQNTESTEGSGETITLNLGGGKNGSATFPLGSCPVQCTIGPTLPIAAKNDLPGDALATVYVRVVGEDGTPYEGSYTVCFDNPDGDTLTIYRYVGGVWTAVQVAASNPICVSASGDGAFYLGG